MAVKKGMSSEIVALSDVLSALEGLKQSDQVWVLETAASRINSMVSGDSIRKPAAASLRALGADHGTRTDPKAFMRTKDPKNDVQRVACLAHFLTDQRKMPHFKARDLSTLNTEAAGPRINISRAVNNATNQNRYLAAAGGGKKQITALGEDVVKALPDQEAARAAEEKGRPKRKRKASREGRGPTKER